MKATVFATLAAAALAACTPTQDTRGELYEVTDNMVTIRGAFDMSLGNAGTPAAPTAAMVAQAREVCPDAQYMTAVPSNLHEYDYTFLYRFRCPTGPARG